MNNRPIQEVMVRGVYKRSRTGNWYFVQGLVLAKTGRRKWWLFGPRKWVNAVLYTRYGEDVSSAKVYVRTLKDFKRSFTEDTAK